MELRPIPGGDADLVVIRLLLGHEPDARDLIGIADEIASPALGQRSLPLLVFSRAKKKSREVAPKLADLLKNANLKDALSLANKKDYKGSHLARVTSAGIQSFMEGKEAKLGFDEQIETATRGSERAKTLFDQELRRGLPIMATIATSAPFIGLFGTIFGIINAFRGMQLTGSGGIVEVQGTAERKPFTKEQFDVMYQYALKGIAEITRQQRATLGPLFPL